VCAPLGVQVNRVRLHGPNHHRPHSTKTPRRVRVGKKRESVRLQVTRVCASMGPTTAHTAPRLWVRDEFTSTSSRRETCSDVHVEFESEADMFWSIKATAVVVNLSVCLQGACKSRSRDLLLVRRVQDEKKKLQRSINSKWIVKVDLKITHVLLAYFFPRTMHKLTETYKIYIISKSNLEVTI